MLSNTAELGEGKKGGVFGAGGARGHLRKKKDKLENVLKIPWQTLI